MHPLLQYPFDANKVLARKKSIRRELLEGTGGFLEKRIAVLGGSTTHDIVLSLELFLLDNGIRPIFYESDFGQYWQDAMFGNAELDAFDPDIVIVHTSTRNITSFPSPTSSNSEVDAMLDTQFEHFETMWDNLAQSMGCPIIQNNFEMPLTRVLGNRDGYDIHGHTRFVSELNRRFGQYAANHEGFYINDIAYLSACYGLESWSEPQYWYLYKYALCVPAIPMLAHNISLIVKAVFGKNKKGLVCDLDNTLWGGIVGDDGVEGIAIGQELAEGEAYFAFQNYLKSLKDIGVVLCVNSKNEYDNAIAGLSHPDGALSPDDFVAIRANWETKDRNFNEIASEINLLPESLVFIDDNPAEREIVSSQIPGVIAPDIQRVEDYIRVIDRSGFFEVITLSADDANRSEMYKANRERAQTEARFEDYESYLTSLSMRAEMTPFDALHLPRITQLINKTNQFNLTTRRYTQAEVEERAYDEAYVTLYGRLEDRFGDNGVVTALIGRIEGAVLDIELWIMSCRVFRRNMEDAMLDVLVRLCREAGIESIRGTYRRTQKNGLVSEFYGTMGFTPLSSDENESVWELPLATYENRNKVIAVKEKEA